MQPRMRHPVTVLPDAMQGLLTVSRAARSTGLPARTAGLVHLRASQINGCAQCVDMHARELRQTGDTDQRIVSVSAWREAPWFTEAERAALALTESATRIADSSEGVPDAVWEEAARHYDETELAALVVEIASINAWNRLNVTIRQPVEQYHD